MRIRSRLLLLVAAVLLPALLGAAIAVAYIFGEEQKFNRESMRETARALALALDRDLARRESMLATLAGSPSLERGELERFYGFASRVARQNDWAIILSDLAGRQLLNTRLPFGAALPPMLSAERENRARLGNEAVVLSDVYLPPAGLGPPSFAIQIPVRREGKVVQFLTLASYARQLQPLLTEQQLPPGWHATIVDRQGVVAARSLEPEKYVGEKVRGGLRAKMAAQVEGAQEGTTLAGVEGTAFFSRAPRSGWTFLVSVPHAVLYGPAYRATVLTAAISLLLLGAALAGALLVSRRVARPVEALREAAQRLGRNEPVLARRSSILELDAVSQAMADASERLRGATTELERRVADAVSSYEQSQRALVQAQKLEALGRLTGGIAHDFNNVLQTLTTGLQVLNLAVTGEQRELIERCQRAVSRGTQLARQLMAFGRVQDVRVETIDTAARLGETRELLAGALPASTRLEFDLAPGLWPLAVDLAQLELALLNLVINARDAMPAGGRIVLGARNQAVGPAGAELGAGEYVMLSVADEGQGMDPEVMARALDPFYTTKGVGKGSGMGLPQAYGFARQNGGTLQLESRRGQGTTVKMYLPRSQAAPEMPREPKRAERALSAAQGRILLVEDDEEVRATVSSGLQAAGFEVESVESGDAALERIERGGRYDAVLTDVVMPGALNGLDLARRVRERHPRIGVVVVTGYSDRKVDLPGVRALPKPYDLRQAVEALNAAMGAAASG